MGRPIYQQQLAINIFVLLLLPQIRAYRASGENRYPFVQDAVFAPFTSKYDYIIVGGGTAGCPLAATLSKNYRVLLLERGDSPYGDPKLEREEFFAENIALSSKSSAVQAFRSEDGVWNTRARVLGGGTCINAGFYSRASQEFVRNAGWDESLVNESYAWIEQQIVSVPKLKQWQNAFRESLLQVGINPDNGACYDHIVGTKTGGSLFDSKGNRHSAADLLQYADSSKIQVLIRAPVKQILLQESCGKQQATGVVYTDWKGGEHQAFLTADENSEVILCAGALGSPQLLLLSGIGPKQSLEPFGIKQRVNLPGVGQGMADNPMNTMIIPSPIRLEISLVEVVGITNFGYFIESASGINTMSLAEPDSKNISNNVHVFPSSPAQESKFRAPQIGLILGKVDGPLSSGNLSIATTNVSDNPRVRFNYFDRREDLEKCVRGVKVVERILKAPAMVKYSYKDPKDIPAELQALVHPIRVLLPNGTEDNIKVAKFCKATVNTLWHYHGGCQVGRVVDSSYRVFSTRSLRVVDGSTFLSSPGTNPQATVMMLGRYMGVQTLRQRGVQT